MSGVELHYHEQKITTQDKCRRNGHKPAVIWLTGLSGSGVLETAGTRVQNDP